jgi:hypothetical protein
MKKKHKKVAEITNFVGLRRDEVNFHSMSYGVGKSLFSIMVMRNLFLDMEGTGQRMKKKDKVNWLREGF